MTKRRTLLAVLSAALLLVIVGIVISICSSPVFASADTETTKVYTLTFDYEYYRVYNFSYSGNFPYNKENWTDGQYSKLTLVNDATTVPIMHDIDGTKDFSISIYGEVPNYTVDSETKPKNAYFNFKIVNIKVPSICQGAAAGWLTHKYRYRITQLSNSKGEMLVDEKFHTKWSDQGPEVVFTGELPDDTYTLHFEYSNWENEWIYYHKINTTFRIDKSAPTISGATISPTGKYTNKEFTVSASDSDSGLSRIYYQAPNSSYYSSVNFSSKTITKGSANGRYKFYAEDKAGNMSPIHYVNFDDTPPLLECTGASFGEATNGNFIVTASDSTSSYTLYYKLNDGAWKSCGNKFATDKNSEYGKYYFYAVDYCGNRSEELWVEAAVLYGEFIKSEENNSVYFTWKQPKWTATLDGKNYRNGDWITAEGKHTVTLASNTNTAQYSYTIEHFYVPIYTDATCTECGYVDYECNQCGDKYTAYSTEETGHYYVASTTAATCTSGGYTVYTCTRCGDSYTDNYTHPLGHNYEATYEPATCTDYGKTVFTCQVCGSSYYETDGTLPTGHNYTSTVITAPTCTTDGLRRSTCDDCGHSYDEKISANGHNYQITDTITNNGVTTRTYTCTECGDSYIQELGDQYEEVSNYVEYLFVQYSPYMWWVLLASAGIWSIAIGVMIAIAQKNEDKEKSRKMLINYVIGLVVIAVIVVACPYLIRGIATLIT